MKLLQQSFHYSIIVQLLTFGLGFIVYSSGEVSNKVLNDLVVMEYAVQLIELFFYIWFASSFKHMTDMTHFRYYDWFITTPTMLVTLCITLVYLRNVEHDNKYGNQHSLYSLVNENKQTLSLVVVLNAIMLLFGYLSEMNIMNTYTSVILGFIPFLYYFYVIYEVYAKHSTTHGLYLFWIMFIIWSLYGISALLSYDLKNICYNILDIFAKNFFGFYLIYLTLS